MLAVVLLHVVEPAGPVEDAHDLVGVERARQGVPDGAGLVRLHVGDRHPGQGAVVGRLAAALGVEGAAVQRHAAAVAGDDMGGEPRQGGVVVIEAVGGHGGGIILGGPERGVPEAPKSDLEARF